jgi:hypothetical protein
MVGTDCEERETAHPPSLRPHWRFGARTHAVSIPARALGANVVRSPTHLRVVRDSALWPGHALHSMGALGKPRSSRLCVLSALSALSAWGCTGEPVAGGTAPASPAVNGGQAAAAGGGPSSGGAPAGGVPTTNAGNGTAIGGSSSGAGAATAAAGAESSAAAFDSVARRSSRAELDSIIADVLGDPSRPASKQLLEDEYAPFDNAYTLQVASQALIDGLSAMASDVAERVLADPVSRARIVACTPSGAGDAACFRSVIESIGARLLRRPLRAEEVEGYLGLQAFATEDNPTVDNDFYTAVGLFLQAVLQDPEFLYRIEVGTPTATAGVFALDDYSIGSRLSFLLWGRGPDEQLLASAQSGALTQAAARRSAAERLLAAVPAREQLRRYHAMWLGYRAIPHGPELTAAFSRETDALLDRVIFDEPRSYLELFTFPETFVDAALADHYGLARPAGDSGWVPYGSTGRAGILAHGSVLSGFSKFSDTSPTQRGIFVRTRLLCQDVSPPPANVDVDQPPGSDQAVCKVERYAEHRASPSCGACHGLFDPIGFGLEQFDVAGRFRSNDEGRPECVIDGQGELPGYGVFSGPAQLGSLLVQPGLLDACAVRQYLTFALGRRPTSAEHALVDARIQGFRDRQFDFTELVLALVESPLFALRKEPTP